MSTIVWLFEHSLALPLFGTGMKTDVFQSFVHAEFSRFTGILTNRLKGLDLIDKVLEELWTEIHNIVQETVIKTILKKKKYKKAKWLSEEALQVAKNIPS